MPKAPALTRSVAAARSSDLASPAMFAVGTVNQEEETVVEGKVDVSLGCELSVEFGP